MASYWQVSRAPRYSLLFALPLLLAYETLAALQPVGPRGALRNGADVILETLFVALAGRWGPLVFMALVIGFGALVGGLTSHVVRPPAVIGASQMEMLGSGTRIMLSLGAGIYEELLFRVVLVTALAWLAEGVFGWRPASAGLWAVLLGAIVFSAVHYLGPYGDRLTPYSFIFRMIAGVFFSALYVLRGFGITAWTHALYDVALLLV